MILKCLSTGSQNGNCYLLSHDSEVLILDAGISSKEILKALNWKIGGINGVLVTHGHHDHDLSARKFREMGISVFAPYRNDHLLPGEHEERVHVKYGSFDVSAFALTNIKGKFMHTNTDGSECPCYGFLIQHPDMGRLIYVTDTELIKWTFKGINHILFGVNYSADMIGDSANKNHVLSGHMSIDTACEFVKNNNQDLRNVIMCHLSGENSNEDIFREKMQKCFTGECFVAKKGTEVLLNLYPF